MKPLILLIVTFLCALAGMKVYGGTWDYLFAGNLAMSVMLLFTALGHFKFSKGMEMMLPGFIPFKHEIVFLTGLIEIAAAIGLLLPQIRFLTAVLLIIFFLFILPANINAALQKIDYEKGTLEGNGVTYLWFRIPLQILFIGWVWLFGINLH